MTCPSQVRASVDALTSSVTALASTVNARFDAVMTSLGVVNGDVALVKALVVHSRSAGCPRAFLLVPAKADGRSVEARGFFKRCIDKGKSIVSVKWHLYLLCEGHDGTAHFTGHEPFEVDAPKDFVVKAAPYMKLLSGVLSVAVKLATGVSCPDFLRDAASDAGVSRLLDAACLAAAAIGGLPVDSITGDLDAAAGVVDPALDARDRVDALRGALQGASDAAVDQLGTLLTSVAGSCADAAAAARIEHVVIGGRGHAWVCTACKGKVTVE